MRPYGDVAHSCGDIAQAGSVPGDGTKQCSMAHSAREIHDMGCLCREACTAGAEGGVGTPVPTHKLQQKSLHTQCTGDEAPICPMQVDRRSAHVPSAGKGVKSACMLTEVGEFPGSQWPMLVHPLRHVASTGAAHWVCNHQPIKNWTAMAYSNHWEQGQED